MEKNWETRFTNRPIGTTLKTRLAIAGGYWILIAVASLILKLAGIDSLAFGLAALSLPSSVLFILRTLSDSGYRKGPEMWVDFPLICGGLNALMIFAILSALQRWRGRS
jgi:hypothetical protein